MFRELGINRLYGDPHMCMQSLLEHEQIMTDMQNDVGAAILDHYPVLEFASIDVDRELYKFKDAGSDKSWYADIWSANPVTQLGEMLIRNSNIRLTLQRPAGALLNDISLKTYLGISIAASGSRHFDKVSMRLQQGAWQDVTEYNGQSSPVFHALIWLCAPDHVRMAIMNATQAWLFDETPRT